MSVCGKCHRDAPEGALFCSHCGATIRPETGAGEAVDPLIGQTVAGKYFIHQLLGHGGMGDVYKATHLTLDRPVVLKLLRKLFHSDASLVQRFHREARAASRLNHPNSINIIDFGQTDDGTLFMAMEYLPGRGLERIIHDDYPLPEGRIIHIVAQVLAALGEAHALGIIHRDLKPANVMVEARRDEPDFVKVLDFGIAKLNEPGAGGAGLTQAGIVCGTPGYMSPEQVRGEELDARSDLYAVGVILYEMLTGVLPFDSETPMGLVTRHLVEEPPPLSDRRPGLLVSPELETVVMRALARDRNDRFASAEEMRGALLACGEARPRVVRPTPAPSTMIFDASTLGPGAAGRPPTGRTSAVRWAPPPQPAPDDRQGAAAPAPAWKSAPGVAAARTPAPAKPAVGKTPAPAGRTPAPAGKTPAPAKARTPAPAKPRTPAPAKPRTPAPAKPRTPAPASKKPSTGPGVRVPPAAPVIHHEMDEEEEGVDAEAAPPPQRSRLPIFAAAGVAVVVLAGLAVWGLTRKPASEAAPASASAPAKPPVAPVAAAVPATQAQPQVPAPPEPPPPAPPKTEPAPPPQPVLAKVQPEAPPPPKAAAPTPAGPKGIRLVRPELNAIPVPAASTGEGILAIQATPWAEVSINGRAIGETPREVLLGAGAYRVRASHPDLGMRESTVKVQAGKRQVLNLTFAK